MKLLRILFIVLFVACSEDGIEEIEPELVEEPAKANLQYPNLNSRCTEGSTTADDKTEIIFRWVKGTHTTATDLMVKNLRTEEVTKFNASEESHAVTLQTGTPYSWWILSYNESTAQPTSSAVWKFYTSGKGITNYAPFPADLVSPANEALLPADKLQVNLEWEGNDVDEEALSYDLYFGEQADFSEAYRKRLNSSSFELEVAPEKSYFWQVITRDAAGNTSESDIGTFSVEKPAENTGGKSSENKINSFSITHGGKEYKGVIDHKELKIHLELDNFDYMKLAPVVETSAGAVVVPASGKSQNFLDDLYYTVTAEDGSVAVYDIIVLSGQHEILDFEVHHNGERYIGIVDGENHTVTIELGGNDFSKMKPIIRTSNRATIDPPAEVGRNFNQDVFYTVTSEKGTTKTFKVIAPLRLREVFPFFGAAGYSFIPETRNERFIMFAGADLNFRVINAPEPEKVTIELVNESGNYPLEILNFNYGHQTYMEVSNSVHHFKTIIPYSIPSGTYNYRIKDGFKETLHAHKIEVINDETTIKITSLNAEEVGFGDTLIISGENLTRHFTVYSRYNHYMFGEYSRETTLAEDRKELTLNITQNVYGNFSGGDSVKPMVVYTTMEGYEHRLVSNTVSFILKSNW